MSSASALATIGAVGLGGRSRRLGQPWWPTAHGLWWNVGRRRRTSGFADQRLTIEVAGCYSTPERHKGGDAMCRFGVVLLALLCLVTSGCGSAHQAETTTSSGTPANVAGV